MFSTKILRQGLWGCKKGNEGNCGVWRIAFKTLQIFIFLSNWDYTYKRSQGHITETLSLVPYSHKKHHLTKFRDVKLLFTYYDIFCVNLNLVHFISLPIYCENTCLTDGRRPQTWVHLFFKFYLASIFEKYHLCDWDILPNCKSRILICDVIKGHESLVEKV